MLNGFHLVGSGEGRCMNNESIPPQAERLCHACPKSHKEATLSLSQYSSVRIGIT